MKTDSAIDNDRSHRIVAVLRKRRAGRAFGDRKRYGEKNCEENDHISVVPLQGSKLATCMKDACESRKLHAGSAVRLLHRPSPTASRHIPEECFALESFNRA
jgi:hypothetical protein